MRLTLEEIKQQTRQLWKTCFKDTDEFLNIYFEKKYTDTNNLTISSDGRVKAAMQLLTYRTKIFGKECQTGYVSGLCVHPGCRRKGLAAQLLRKAHRRLYEEGGLVSFLIPGGEELRAFYEKPEHGAYSTATYRAEVVITDNGFATTGIEITQPEEWGADMYAFCDTHPIDCPTLCLSENDFFAALSATAVARGFVLVAHQQQRIVGICTAIPETDGRINVSNVWASDAAVRDAFQRWLTAHTDAASFYTQMPVPQTVTDAVPYAMARVVGVKPFLEIMARAFPETHLHIGVVGDLDIPENNGYYLVADGHVTVKDEISEYIVTPGQLIALFFNTHPFRLPMMLDE